MNFQKSPLFLLMTNSSITPTPFLLIVFEIATATSLAVIISFLGKSTSILFQKCVSIAPGKIDITFIYLKG